MQKGDILKRMPRRSSKHIWNKTEEFLFRVGDMALKRRARSIIESLNLKDGGMILDAGCGDGFYLHLLSNLGIDLKLTGVDINEEGLASAKLNLKKEDIVLIQADLMKKLPFPSNSFDSIVVSEVVEHLQNDINGLKELYRVLKPGGALALTVPCRNYPFFWDPVNWLLEHLFNIHIKTGFWAGIWNQHLRLYSLVQINSRLRSAGFSIVKSEIQTFWCLPFNHHILNLGARLLTGGYLPDSIKYSVNKFSTGSKSRASLTNIFFIVVNMIDKLNDIFSIKSSGVSIFVKAEK